MALQSGVDLAIMGNGVVKMEQLSNRKQSGQPDSSPFIPTRLESAAGRIVADKRADNVHKTPARWHCHAPGDKGHGLGI